MNGIAVGNSLIGMSRFQEWLHSLANAFQNSIKLDLFDAFLHKMNESDKKVSLCPANRNINC